MKPNGRRRNPPGGRPGAWKPLESTFWPFIRKTEGCWLWEGALNRDGYGRVGYQGMRVLAHRLSFAMANNRDVCGLRVIRHACDVPKCVNPAHLSEGTQADNNRDMTERGRHVRGERHHWHGKPYRGVLSATAKLSEADVSEVRRQYAQGIKTRIIAAAFRISDSTVTQIATGGSWAHLPGASPRRRPASGRNHGSGVLPARGE